MLKSLKISIQKSFPPTNDGRLGVFALSSLLGAFALDFDGSVLTPDVSSLVRAVAQQALKKSVDVEQGCCQRELKMVGNNNKSV